jgi:hypothetical protein
MAGNNNEKATPLSRHGRESTGVKDCNQRWDNIKLDVFRMYIQEKKPLEATMAAIQGSHGLQARSVGNFDT